MRANGGSHYFVNKRYGIVTRAHYRVDPRTLNDALMDAGLQKTTSANWGMKCKSDKMPAISQAAVEMDNMLSTDDEQPDSSATGPQAYRTSNKWGSGCGWREAR